MGSGFWDALFSLIKALVCLHLNLLNLLLNSPALISVELQVLFSFLQVYHLYPLLLDVKEKKVAVLNQSAYM